MSFVNHNPFLRVLLPFVTGICMWLLGFQESSPMGLSLALFSFLVVLFLTMRAKTSSGQKFAFGILTQLFLFLAGWFLCELHNAADSPSHYSHFLSSEPEWYSAEISDLPAEKSKTIKLELNLTELKTFKSWTATEGKIIAYVQKDSLAHRLQPGNKIVFKGILQPIPPPLNPHEFDYRNYLELKNIHHSVYLKSGSWTETKQPENISLYTWAQHVRQYLVKTYRESGLGADEFAMVAALVLGYDEEIDQPLMNAYSHTGTLHVLSVSGLHVGVIYLLLGYMLAFMDKRKSLKWMKVCLILAILWFFVLLSGFSAPAVRAALMFSLILIGKTLFQNVETTNIVFVSAFISLVYNPFWLADVGFQLSYTAVLGIIFLYPRIYQSLTFSSGWMEKIWALCSVSIAAQIATLPLTLYYFHQFPLLFLITNIILIPISIVVMYGGMLLLVFSKVTFVSKELVWLTSLLVKFMNGCALFFDGLPFCVVDGIHISLISVILLYALIIITVAAFEQRSFRLLTATFSLAIAMVVLSLVPDILQTKKSAFTIYHASASVATFLEGCNATVISDTLPDARFQSTLNEHLVQNDIMRSDTLALPDYALILAGQSRVLFCKDAKKINERLLRTCSPDVVWIPSLNAKKKRDLRKLMEIDKLVISGKLYKIPELPSSWMTQERGAFTLSLQ